MARILLVDDEELVRAMVKDVLEGAGHEVVVARNGIEAQESYRRRRPELLITDIVMPDREGIETIIDFRASCPGVKIIAMSGGGRNDGRDYLVLAKSLGAAHTLAKPFSNSELLAAVEAAVKQ